MRWSLALGFGLLLLLAGCVFQTNGGNSPVPLPPQNGTTPPPVISGGWLSYAPVQANTNPWQVVPIPFVDEKTEAEQVEAWLNLQAISYSQFAFIPRDMVTCEALNCPRGDHLVIHPSTSEDYAKLLTQGFFVPTQPFVIVSHDSDALSFTTTLVNASEEVLFYGGCNNYTLEKITTEGIVSIPPVVCVWEGIPSTLDAGKSVSFSGELKKPAAYRVSVGYGTGCDAQQPLGQARCTGGKTLYSNTFFLSGEGMIASVQMRYSIRQCNSNPWQQPPEGEQIPPGDDLDAFAEWAENNELTPTTVTFQAAPPDTVVCASCSCGTGAYYSIEIPSNQRAIAEALGFEYVGSSSLASEPPPYDEATWFVYTPYQCFANKWNTNHEIVRTVAKDMRLMKEWLEEQGVTVSYLTYIQGYIFSQQCTKASTDRYGVGTLDTTSADLLSTLGFIRGGKTQVELFTDTSNEEPVSLVYKTKFCALPPWGQPELANGNEAAVVERVTAWLNEQGVPALEGPTIHSIFTSPSGSCETDSGLGVRITIPAWSETHLGPYGFLRTAATTLGENTQVYPILVP